MAINDELSAVDAAMKIYYKGGKMVKLAYKDHPFLALVRKNKGFKGLSVPIVPWFARTAGQSHTLTSAQANASSEETEAFQVKVKRNYTVTTLDRMNMLATASDEGSYLKLMTDAVSGAAMVHTNDIAGKLYRNHGGARGRIAVGGVSGNVLTLENPGDIVNFEKNMRLVQSTADGTSGSLGSGDSTVTAVDRINGKITLASSTNFVAQNYLFLHGDFGNAYYGIASWAPTTAPTVGGGDSFLGVDRSADSRLYGQYMDAVTLGLSFEEAIGQADVRLAREGHKPDRLFCNPINFDTFRQSLGSQVVYDKVASPDKASISFDTIRFQGVKGPVQIVPDADCPQGEFVLTQMDTWVLWSIGEVPQGAEANGQKYITQAAADGAEVRLASYAQLASENPGATVRIKVA